MTEESTPLYEVLYCSTLAQDLPPTTVGTIASQARVRNAELGITGLLVFDGMRFCQHLEGPHDAVDQLMQRIAQDPRHVGVRVAYEAPLASRRYTGFGMGLAECEGPDLMAGVHALDGKVALGHFLALLPSFDING
ncbi:BLUF domain-containing protein [Variovorax sp. EL159]|uniref:BLUF domain-containing protein n=1 Tax=Variovorax sp. EL159 TaxID=1566270 RepID=UPI00087F7638|nr:BLUF domain-containing protein [Variovorax sp. EL159]SCX72981.1 Sensors of blue-light using FAD [Variovorax sp. EL159]